MCSICSDVALWSVIGLTVWKNAGYYMLFYIAGLQNVPRDTIEAAMIDGANAWQRLRFVILPALAPTTAFVVVIALIQLLTNVDQFLTHRYEIRDAGGTPLLSMVRPAPSQRGQAPARNHVRCRTRRWHPTRHSALHCWPQCHR